MRILMDKGISAAPIVDRAGKLKGFVSDGDLLRHLTRRDEVVTDPVVMITQVIGEGNRSKGFSTRMVELMGMPVSSIARRRVVSVSVHDDLLSVSKTLGANHLKKVPVVDADGCLVGVVNRSDIIGYSMRTCLDAAESERLETAKAAGE